MEQIESFKINHLNLKKGLYVSRKDKSEKTTITTFDIRLTEPNKEKPVKVSALHTIEHLGATFLRNVERKEDIVYFGPMGCRTGCYLLMFGDLKSEDVYPLIVKMCEFILGFEGEIPGAKPNECGNYSEHNLKSAKKYISKYLNSLKNEKNFEYKA